MNETEEIVPVNASLYRQTKTILTVFSHQAPPPVTRETFRCSVSYKNTYPFQILTSYESDAIFIDNIPLSFTEDDINDTIHNLGHTVLQMQVEFSSSGDTNTWGAKILLSSREEAAEAVKKLRNSSSSDPMLSFVHLASRGRITHNWRPPAFSRSVKFSYANPTRVAWVFFGKMSHYKAAEGLNGKTLKNRTIRVVKAQRTKKKHDSFVLRVEGLPIDIHKPEIEAFFKDAIFVELVSKAAYSASPNANVEALLLDCGELEEILFDLSPPNEKPRSVGFARFVDSDAAALAERRGELLDGRVVQWSSAVVQSRRRRRRRGVESESSSRRVMVWW
jgi:RNA recognition motif-containing protein